MQTGIEKYGITDLIFSPNSSITSVRYSTKSYILFRSLSSVVSKLVTKWGAWTKIRGFNANAAWTYCIKFQGFLCTRAIIRIIFPSKIFPEDNNKLGGILIIPPLITNICAIIIPLSLHYYPIFSIIIHYLRHYYPIISIIIGLAFLSYASFLCQCWLILEKLPPSFP